MIYSYDVEVFPNFFSAIFSNVEEDFDEHIFLIYGERDDREKLREFVKGKTLVGYNSLYFDNMMLNAVLEGYTVEQLYKLAHDAISEEPSKTVWDFRRKKTSYSSIDLMAMYAFDKMGISLKQVSILLKWHRVQEYDQPFDKPIEPHQVSQVLQYNTNDVLVTKKLYLESLKIIKARQESSKVYGIDFVSASDSKIANLILEKMYGEHTAIHPNEFKLGRTPRDIIHLKDCISPAIVFRSPVLCKLLVDLKETTLYSTNNFAFKRVVKFGDKIYDMGVGGLHSRDEPARFDSNDYQEIIDADVASFYPNIMLLNRIKPAHLSDHFIDILNLITTDRIKAKDNKETAKALILKITINSIFGKLGFPDFWLYDPKAFYSVTLNGQLYLLMFIEHLILNGIEVISANTDGVVCRVEDKAAYEEACKMWQFQTQFKLEFASYQTYARKDVNNYIALKKGAKRQEDGTYPEDDVKKKGIFENRVLLNKPGGPGYTIPIIPQALVNYFLYGISVEQTVSSSRNIYDFFIFQKIHKKFHFEYREQTTQIMQRMSRFYASPQGGELIKVATEEKKASRVASQLCLWDEGEEDDQKMISMLAGVGVKVLNDVPLCPFEDFQVDLNYYIQQAQEIVERIEESQEEQLALW